MDQAENGDLTWFKQERRPKHQHILPFTIVKWSVVLRLGIKNAKLKMKFCRQSFTKNIGKIAQVRKNL